MKISYKWLKEFVDIDLPAEQLRDDLVMVGIAVESVVQETGDFIFEIEGTANRPDWLSHLGVAREIATIYGKELIRPKARDPMHETEDRLTYSIDIADDRLCPRYSALLINHVRVGPSPDWLVKRLLAVGQRPVNNIVDITNYVLYEFGHPLHAFDFAKLRGRKIIVRTARTNEKLVTLDSIERALEPSMLVIADESRPVALAGVIGGLESEISPSTDTILLESAYFDPRSIRRTAKKLGLGTEASYRFERGADVNATVLALSRTSHLISQVAGGKICGELIDVYPKRVKEKFIKLRHRRIARLIGVEIENSFIEGKLTSLGFETRRLSKGVWRVRPPSFRVDCRLEVDLIEEIARHYGYDKIPTTLPAWRGKGEVLPQYDKENLVHRTLTGLGYNEVINWSFVNAAEESTFRRDTIAPLQIANPLSEVDSVLRTSLLANLLKVVLWNFNHGIRNIKIYELGKAYFLKEHKPCEQKVLGLALTGAVTDLTWMAKEEKVNFYNLKGAIETLFNCLGIRDYEILPRKGLSFFHPNISAEISYKGTRLGVLGRLHPNLEESYKTRQEVFLAELEIERIFSLPAPEVAYKQVPKFPAITRDISFIVDKDLEYHKVERRIIADGIPELEELRLFDVYQDEQITAGKKSMSIRLKFLNPGRTLTDEEATGFANRIKELLRTEFNAGLR